MFGHASRHFEVEGLFGWQLVEQVFVDRSFSDSKTLGLNHTIAFPRGESITFGFLAVLVVLYVLVSLVLRRSSKHPLPPGPKPLPLIGNVLDIPAEQPWEKWFEWCKLYSKYS